MQKLKPWLGYCPTVALIISDFLSPCQIDGVSSKSAKSMGNHRQVKKLEQNDFYKT